MLRIDNLRSSEGGGAARVEFPQPIVRHSPDFFVDGDLPHSRRTKLALRAELTTGANSAKLEKLNLDLAVARESPLSW